MAVSTPARRPATIRTTPAPSDDAPIDSSEGTLSEQEGRPDAPAPRLASSLYELWEPEELRRHVAILEAELARVAQSRAELEALRRWKAEVEASRTWRLARGIARVRRLPSRARRIAAGR